MTLLVCNAAIAGGKTGLANSICEKIHEIYGRKVIIIDERVDAVTNVAGENLLKNFYRDPGRWAFTMQFYYLITRVKYCNDVIDNNDEDAIFIMERDWFADRYCFAETLHKDGFMTESEWFTYQDTFTHLVGTKNVPRIDGYIFIDCSIDTHMTRMRIRAREEEVGVKREYEEQLISKHRKMEQDYISKGIPVHVIDGELNFKDDCPERDKILDELRSFMESFITLLQTEK